MNIEDYKDIFEPFKKLIEIEILGETREVPEHNSLFRCFQYLSMETVSYGNFCWNGECAKCQVWLENTATDKPVSACRTKMREYTKIVKMCPEIKLDV